jgi:hypothetical protein
MLVIVDEKVLLVADMLYEPLTSFTTGFGRPGQEDSLGNGSHCRWQTQEGRGIRL